MNNHTEFQDIWGQGTSGDLILHESDFERDERIRQECTEWETHSDSGYESNRVDQLNFETELVGYSWSHEILLKCVQQKLCSSS